MKTPPQALSNCRPDSLFSVFNFQEGGTLVSLRSVDTNEPNWSSRMVTHMNDLSSVMDQGAAVFDQMGALIPTGAIFHLVVQPGGSPAANAALAPHTPDNVVLYISEFK